MKKTARSIASTRVEWALGLLALACGSSDEAARVPAFAPPMATPAPSAEAPQTPAEPPSAPSVVDSNEGAPGDAALDGTSAGEASGQPPAAGAPSAAQPPAPEPQPPSLSHAYFRSLRGMRLMS